MTKPKKPPEPKWQTSKGKQLLIQDLEQGRIPVDGRFGDAKEIYAIREEFGGTNKDEFKKFSARLRSARKQVKQSMKRASDDSIALAHDRAIYPKNAIDQCNRPRWEGSMAQQLLQNDVATNHCQELIPKELYQSREEYRVFSLKVFRGHVHQEVRRQKSFK
jgi:hypothetical protein